MASKVKVIWTSEAIENIETIIQYLRSRWSEKEVIKFVLKLDKAIKLIIIWPNLFKETNHRLKLRKLVLTKQTSIIYKAEESVIYIVSILDNRQDPNKL